MLILQERTIMLGLRISFTWLQGIQILQKLGILKNTAIALDKSRLELKDTTNTKKF